MEQKSISHSVKLLFEEKNGYSVGLETLMKQNYKQS